MKKNIFKRVIAFMLVLAMTFSVAACSNNKKIENETKPITLVDQAGREVTLDKPAEKIVSCYYITTYATMALGIEDRVVGLEKKAGKRNIYKLAFPELTEKPQVGSLKKFNVEAAAALKPDLVLMPKKLMEHAKTLEDLGIKVLVVNPESQELMQEMLILIAKACAVEKNAEKLISYYDKNLKKIQKITAKAQKPTVYMAGNGSFLTTAPGGMYQSDLITLAGGKNAAQDMQGDYWIKTSYETILKLDPEYIIIPCGAQYKKEDVLNDAQLKNVKAVKNKKVYEMPQKLEEWDSPVPSGILGVMWLTSVLHEDEYSFESFKNDATYYYKTFYGFDVDKALITK